MSNMFEKATKLKLRFASSVGSITTEDLWDISLPQLDEIAKSLRSAVKESGDESFIEKPTPKNTTLELRFDIVKHVIEVRLASKEAAGKRADTIAQKQKLLAILADKQDEDLKGKSAEEIQKLIEEL